MANLPRTVWGKGVRVQIARDKYQKMVFNIDEKKGNGSEYWMVDVVDGVSQVQHNGTSLHNSTNADAIAALVD